MTTKIVSKPVTKIILTLVRYSSKQIRCPILQGYASVATELLRYFSFRSFDFYRMLLWLNEAAIGIRINLGELCAEKQNLR